MAQAISLIVGLGNPGPEYSETRHNAGFRFLDVLLSGTDIRLVLEPRFKAMAARATLAGHDVWLLAPQTFMNHSGESVQAFASFYKIAPSQMLVAHDELDIAPGAIRLKVGGGTGGHNGLTDIVEKLGSKDFARLRIGIGHPGTAAQVTNYVLRRAPAAEQELIDHALDRARAQLGPLLAGEHQKVMNSLHIQPV